MFVINGVPFVRDIKHQLGDKDGTAAGIVATFDRVYQETKALSGPNQKIELLIYLSDSCNTQVLVRKMITERYGAPGLGCSLHQVHNTSSRAGGLDIAGFPEATKKLHCMVNIMFNTKTHNLLRRKKGTAPNQLEGKPTSRNSMEWQGDFMLDTWALDNEDTINEIIFENKYKTFSVEVRDWFLEGQNWDTLRIFESFGAVFVAVKKLCVFVLNIIFTIQ